MSDVPPSAPELPEADFGAAPHLQILAQYLKDLSFENLNAPQSLMDTGEQMQIEVSVNLEAESAGEGRYAIDLTIEASAHRGNERAFLVEVVYGGLFHVQNIPPEAVQVVCLVECPRILFPYARRILSDATRDGGFPPLLVEPIDFYRLYRERQAETEAAAGDGEAEGGAGDGED